MNFEKHGNAMKTKRKIMTITINSCHLFNPSHKAFLYSPKFKTYTDDKFYIDTSKHKFSHRVNSIL